MLHKIVDVALLVAGAVVFVLSLMLWMDAPPPRLSSAAALPLAASTMWFGLAILQTVGKYSAEIQKKVTTRGKDGLVAVVMAAIYVLGAIVGLNFYVLSLAFMYVSMCYFRRKLYVSNAIWSVGFMLAVYVVFGLLFGVEFF